MKYTIGLDIGITSVGWSVINLDKLRIEDLGVRIFDKAENPKDGKPLAAPRREARGRRRTIRRKSHRIQRIKNLLSKSKVLKKDEIDRLYDKSFDIDVWDLRYKALERLLTNDELTRVLIHIAKRRGFKSNIKSQNIENNDEGKLLQGISINKSIFDESEYRTIGEMFAKDNKFKDHKRNKDSSYLNTISRDMLENEIKKIFKSQRELGNIYTTEKFEKEYLDIFLSQRPFASKEQIEKLIGYCTFEKKEKRAPKATYSFQRFMAIQKINNIRLIKENKTIELTDEQRKEILNLCFNKNIVKYIDIRKVISLDDKIRFKELYYLDKEAMKKTENKKFIELKEYHQIKKLLDSKYNKDYISKLSCEELDQIAYILTVCKNDEEIYRELNKLGMDKILMDVLSELSFTKVGHLSLKAIKNILPYLEKGYTYDKACDKAKYNFKCESNTKSYLLPIIDAKDIGNPVVVRALSQSRKVINAIIKEYGSPTSIHIETARELSKTFNEREEIKIKHDKNKLKNEKAIKKIEQLLNISNPRGIDIVKYKLWEEQQGYCLYSGLYIDPEKIFEEGYNDIDHILPYSRSLDDSYNNKVLVLSSENRQKGNKTPYEYLGSDYKKWKAFESIVEGNKNINNIKRKNLLKRDYDERDEVEFKERNLNDTRYITRYLYNFINDNLIFKDSEYKKKVHAVNGSITAYVRARLGFNKNRNESDLHHALDAVIVAITTDKMIKDITEYTKVRESRYLKQKGKFINRESGKIIGRNDYDKKFGIMFPEPWMNFRKELEVRMGENPADILNNINLKNYRDLDIEKIKPIFVSRMPRRKITGEAHESTIRSNKGIDIDGKYKTAVKTKLENIKFDKNGDFNMYDKESSLPLYNAIKERYLEFKDNKKAFSKPLYKPTKEGKNAPIVKSIKIEKKQNRINTINDGKGIVDNSRIVRTDVFYKDKKYYLIPIYTIDTKKIGLPNKAITDKKRYEEWIEIDNTYKFLFSLCSNDLVKIKHKRYIKAKDSVGSKIELKELIGYYKGVDSSTAGITLISHDNKIEAKGIGSKTLLEFEKYEIDMLGRYKKIENEVRKKFDI